MQVSFRMESVHDAIDIGVFVSDQLRVQFQLTLELQISRVNSISFIQGIIQRILLSTFESAYHSSNDRSL